jgi:hypothetical protein
VFNQGKLFWWGGGRGSTIGESQDCTNILLLFLLQQKLLERHPVFLPSNFSALPASYGVGVAEKEKKQKVVGRQPTIASSVT